MNDDAPTSNVQSSQPSSKHSSVSSTQSSRGKSDPAWAYFTLQKEGKNNVFTCLFCSKSYKGGGINRMKQHLAGVTGQISSCKSVNHDVRYAMKESFIQSQKKNQKEELDEAYEGSDDVVEEDNQIASQEKQKVVASQGKRKINDISGNFFAPRTTPGSQPTLKSVLSSKESVHRAKMAVAKWFYDACIPFNAIQSPYFQPALDAINAIGPGFKGPSYHELRVNLLGDCKRECQLLVESYRHTWSKVGCTIMADGWTDTRQRTLINFLVYCPTGIAFVKSVDASDVVKDAKNLFTLFSEVIEWVGPSNVVHVVTDNAANYVAAGRLIHEKYEHIYWSPCAAHCLNLLLKDIGSMPCVADLASKASKITVFVYNHMVFLSWLRKREGWKEIVRPGATRFATTFITLKSIYDHKHDLQALMVDKHFRSHRLSRTATGKMVSDIILDNKFWNDCLIIVKVVGPLIRLLRIVDGDEKPSLGYIYEGMKRAKHAVKVMFNYKKRLYLPYVNIIKARWDKHLKRGLHAMAYYLNPAFYWDPRYKDKSWIVESLITYFEKKSICDDISKPMREMRLYEGRQMSFSRESALTTSKKVPPGKHIFIFNYYFYLDFYAIISIEYIFYYIM